MTSNTNFDLAPACAGLTIHPAPNADRTTADILLARTFRYAGFDDRTFAAAMLDPALPFGSGAPQATEFLRLALQLGDEAVAWLLHTGFPYPGAVGEILRHQAARVGAANVTSWVSANFFVGLAVKSLLLGGASFFVRIDGGTVPTLSAAGRKLVLTTTALRQAFDAVDVAAYTQLGTSGLWNVAAVHAVAVEPVPQASATAMPPIVVPLTGQAEVPGETPDTFIEAPAAAAVLAIRLPTTISAAVAASTNAGPSHADDVGQDWQATSVAPTRTMAAGALLMDEDPIAALIDSFAASGSAPAAKPHLMRPTVRIFLHELGLVEADTIGALRLALATTIAPAFRKKVLARSSLYGVTKNAGRRFNNVVTAPDDCAAIARLAKDKPGSYWRQLTREQQAEREQRWRAWVDFLAQVLLTAGPMPAVSW